MDKVIKRAAMAQRQASRRTLRRKKEAMHVERLGVQQEAKTAAAELKKNVKDARRARKEDWELGPLAPKRDLGLYNNYGAIKERFRYNWNQSMEKFTSPAVVEERCRWAGGPNQLNLAVGDRVAIMDGPDKGKIDRIKSIHKETGSVMLTTYNKVLVSNILTGAVSDTNAPLSIAAIRLVYPLTNPQTGITRDVIINELKAVRPNMQSDNMTYDRWEYGVKWDRMVPGLNVVIPWPQVEAPKHETHDVDTARELAEDRSFFYNMLSPPMPGGVLDELRNKYSKHRTRHEPWYVAKKEAEEAQKKRRRDTIASMQTPLGEFHQKQREKRAAAGEPELSDEMLEKLGQIMAESRAASLEDAGISGVVKGEALEKSPPGPQ